MTMINYAMQVEKYMDYLRNEERSSATICQYERDVLCFFSFLNLNELTKAAVLQYKQELMKEYQPVSVNVKLSALNSFFSFIGREDLKLKLLKIQKSVYCPEEKELSKSEYFRLVQAAERKKNRKLALLLQTICGTGIRVSEVKYITAEAVNCGEAVIQLKGKTRTILLP